MASENVCCFLCLQLVDLKGQNKNAVSLNFVQRYLKIKEKEIEVDLCKSCGNIANGFTKAFLLLEKAEIEVHYWIERIHKQISGATGIPETVQINSERNSNDPKEDSEQIVFVDNLRKEIAMKSLRRPGILLSLKVKLSRLDSRLITSLQTKAQNADTVSYRKAYEEELQNCAELLPDTPDDQSPPNEWKSHSGEEHSLDNDSVPILEDIQYIKVEVPAVSQPLSSSPSKILPSEEKTMWIENSATGTFDCLACKKKLTTALIARLHYENIHLGIKNFKCELCDHREAFKGNLKFHMNKIHGLPLLKVTGHGQQTFCNPKTGKYYCGKCKKEFVHRRTARDHFQMAHLHKSFKCDICSVDFSSSSNLVRHTKTCKDLFSRRQAKQFEQRERQNDPEYKFICENKTCKKRFSSGYSMRFHYESVHLNKRSYQCDLCEKTFKVAFHFREHKAVVHFGRKLKCKFCNKELKYKSDLRVHEQNCQKRTKTKTESLKKDY